jgi:hypothetical protein
MIRLQERVTALYGAPASSLPTQLRHFVTWLKSEPFLAATLAALPAVDQTPEAWLEEHVTWGIEVAFPAEEAETVAACWLIVLHTATQEDPGQTMTNIAYQFTHGRTHTIDDRWRSFLDTFVDPIVTWIKERVLKDDLIVHTLERYAREAAWFRRDELRALYESDTGKGEDTLDGDLRHRLFQEGIDYPFSQARGPSGRPDIVVPDEEDEPLPLEVKVYDPARDRGDAWVRSGFVQAIEYAHDYRRPDAYLAIFDASTDGLAVHGDDPGGHPPRVLCSGVTVFIVSIPIGSAQPASGRKTAKRRTLDGDYFRATGA